MSLYRSCPVSWIPGCIRTIFVRSNNGNTIVRYLGFLFHFVRTSLTKNGFILSSRAKFWIGDFRQSKRATGLLQRETREITSNCMFLHWNWNDDHLEFLVIEHAIRLICNLNNFNQTLKPKIYTRFHDYRRSRIHSVRKTPHEILEGWNQFPSEASVSAVSSTFAICIHDRSVQWRFSYHHDLPADLGFHHSAFWYLAQTIQILLFRIVHIAWEFEIISLA